MCGKFDTKKQGNNYLSRSWDNMASTSVPWYRVNLSTLPTVSKIVSTAQFVYRVVIFHYVYID